MDEVFVRLFLVVFKVLLIVKYFRSSIKKQLKFKKKR
jgi:hypothetical protein